MKIITWNVNGLRAIWKKNELQNLLDSEKPDIVGLQETKSEVSQLTKEQIYYKDYSAFFESCKIKKGYSGVGIYTNLSEIKIHYSLGYKDTELVDNEGRTIMLEHANFYLCNCYFPNGGKSKEHFEYKLLYYEKFLEAMKKLEKKKPVIFMGDINAARTELDLARPKENDGKVGFTQIERDHMQKYAEEFVDIWRELHPTEMKYTWWDQKSRARDRNIGWRIDYIYISKVLKDKVKSVDIKNDIFGSDHCPIILEINF